MAAFLYTIQLYCDFSGYSNIALGVAKLFGIRLLINFKTPYFAINISEFWSKWHISLTTWMMDYVFTPLTFIFRKNKKIGLIISIIITFLIVGLWHGANWNFIVFGILQSILFIPLIYKGQLYGNKPNNFATSLSPFKRCLSGIILFLFIAFSFILLRSENINQAFYIYLQIFSFSKFGNYDVTYSLIVLFIFIVIFFSVEWVGRNYEYAIYDFNKIRNKLIRWGIYMVIILSIWSFARDEQIFIYFQF